MDLTIIRCSIGISYGLGWHVSVVFLTTPYSNAGSQLICRGYE